MGHSDTDHRPGIIGVASVRYEMSLLKMKRTSRNIRQNWSGGHLIVADVNQQVEPDQSDRVFFDKSCIFQFYSDL